MNAPVAPVHPTRRRIHGAVLHDEYAWLRDRKNPRVIEYLKAENAYTERMMRRTKPLERKLYREMRRRIKEDDASVPEHWGGYWYSRRFKKGAQYPIHVRRRGSLKAREEIVLDENAVAKGHAYCNVGAVRVSPDHRLLAYGVDMSGDEKFSVRFREIATGRERRETLRDAGYGFEWSRDAQTVFYLTLDRAHRPYRLFRHRLGTPQKEDRLVYEERDERFSLSLATTKSGDWIIVNAHSKTATEARVIPTAAPEARPRLLLKRRPNVEYFVEHEGGYFYLLTNDRAKNFRVVRMPVAAPARGRMEEVVPHRPDTYLEELQAFAGRLVLFFRRHGNLGLRIVDLANGRTHDVAFDEPAYAVTLTRNPEFRTDVLRFVYASLVTPRSVYDYDMARRTRVPKKRDTVRGYYPKRYRSERVWARATDGTRIPISLVYRRPFRRDGSRPLLLYGYGAYGASMDPWFSSNRVSLLDRGVVYAIAHVRGGAEMGRDWYEHGKFHKKSNTFNDFIACAEKLLRDRSTSRDRLAIMGASAGGFLIGNVLNRRPDLFHSAVADVPFVDVLSTMLDASLPLTVGEYLEWGNPRERAFFRTIRRLSPYDNVRRQKYPHLLVTAGLNDPRVGCWEPAKWVARLRARKTDKNLLLLKTNMGAGHGGASGRFHRLKEVAFEYAFLLDRWGIKK